MAEYYTFIYCFDHDDGCIIKGRHSSVPEGYIMQHSTTCDFSDWRNMGVIQSNGSTFNVIEPVRINYDRYAGGFIFALYQDTLTDEKGNPIPNKALDTWIRANSDKKEIIYE